MSGVLFPMDWLGHQYGRRFFVLVHQHDHNYSNTILDAIITTQYNNVLCLFRFSVFLFRWRSMNVNKMAKTFYIAQKMQWRLLLSAFKSWLTF